MLDVVDVLETIGENAKIKGASNAELGLALERMDVDPVTSAAILSRDSLQLEQMLDVDMIVCCVQWPGGDEDGDGREEGEERDDQPDETPADDDNAPRRQ